MNRYSAHVTEGYVGMERMSMNEKRNLGRLASLAVALAAILVVTACGGGGSAEGGGGAGAEISCKRSRTGARSGSRPTRPTGRSPSRLAAANSRAST